MATRGSYVHTSMVRFSGGIPKMLVLCNFLEILMVSDKIIHKAFRTRTTLKTKPITHKKIVFPIYQNYTLVLMTAYQSLAHKF